MLQWIPAALYAVFIFYLSSQPYLGIPIEIQLLDPESIMLHIFEYIPLGFLLSRGVSKTPRFESLHPIILPVMLGAAYGLSDEFHQIFVPGRTPNLIDAAADTLGVVLGAYVWRLWVHSHTDTNFKK